MSVEVVASYTPEPDRCAAVLVRLLGGIQNVEVALARLKLVEREGALKGVERALAELRFEVADERQ